MNVNSDSPHSPDEPAPAADGAEPAAKPPRARRVPTAKAVAAATSPVPGEAAAPSEPVVAPAVAPVRRRRKAEEPARAAEGSSAANATSDLVRVEASRSIEQAPSVSEAWAERSDAPASPPAHVGAGTTPQPAQLGMPEPGDTTATPLVAGATENQGAGGEDGPRGRRRNRRDRKRRERGDGQSEGGDTPGAGAERAMPALAQAAVAQAGELFAKVMSGAFDVDGEAPAPEAAAVAPEPAPMEGPTAEGEAVPLPAAEAEAEAYKRVLAAEADAPKLHKVLAQAGIGSRRDMEEMILDGSITVNGEPAHVGQRISFGDQIKVNGKPVKVRIMPPPARLIAYHKPVGEIVTHDDPQNRPTVYRRLPRLAQGKWQSVGRLDINTEGLLLFTNSGELAHQLMHPRFGVEREYAVRVLGTLESDAKERLLAGVEVEGQTANFRAIEEGGGEGVNRWYRVVITEGRNREVRKLFDAVGLTVNRLIRIRYGCVVLPYGLKRGVWVDLPEEEVRAVRSLAGGGRGDSHERNERNDRDGPRPNGRGPERGPRPPKQRNDRGGGPGDRQRDQQRGDPQRPRPPQPQVAQAAQDREPVFERDPDPDFDSDHDFDHRTIPNPLEQTFDKRFVQNPRSPAGGRGFGRGGGGFGAGGSAPQPSGPRRGSGPKEPDPLQTSVGYIGADAFHRKGKGGRGGGQGGGGGFGGGGGRRGR